MSAIVQKIKSRNIVKVTNNEKERLRESENENDSDDELEREDIKYTKKQINLNNDTIEANKIIGTNGIPVTINKIDTNEIGNYEVSDIPVPIQFINPISGQKVNDIYEPLKIFGKLNCEEIKNGENNIKIGNDIILSKIPLISGDNNIALVTKNDLLSIFEEINNLKIKIELLQEKINYIENKTN